MYVKRHDPKHIRYIIIITPICLLLLLLFFAMNILLISVCIGFTLEGNFNLIIDVVTFKA